MFDQKLCVRMDTEEKVGQFIFPPFIRVQWGGRGAVIPVECDRTRLGAARGWAGDYTLKGYERITAVERKRDVDEVYRNVTDEDRTRFLKALDRLALVRHPYLVLAFSPYAFKRKHKYIMYPTDALDRLLYECMIRNIPVVNAPENRSPRVQGEFVLRLLIAGLKCRSLFKLPCSCDHRSSMICQTATPPLPPMEVSET